MDYLKAVTEYSDENRSSDEAAVLPDQAGKKVVDYLAVSEQWKEVKGRMCRVDQEETDCGTEH